MAIRVRKLAKEVRRSAGEVLGLLHHLGYVNYKRPDDMVADGPADKLRRAVRQGQTAAPLKVVDRKKATVSPSQAPASDLMAQLVPGVVKQGQAAPPVAPSRPVPAPRPAPSPPPVPPRPASVPVVDPAVAVERDALADRVAELEQELQRLQEAHDALQAELEAAQTAPPDGTPVSVLLEERGLRGSDEVLRGVEALLGFRQGLELLDARLTPAAAAELKRTLSTLVLLDGPPPSELTLPAVAVSEARAEGPGAATLDRYLHELSEHMLLSGWRRLELVGVPPRWHEAITERLDRRVEIGFQPAGEWPSDKVAAVRADLVGAVKLSAPEAAMEASAAEWVLADDLGALLRRLVRAVRADG